MVVGVEETTTNVIVVSLLGQPVIVNKIYKRCPLEVQEVVFLENLMELSFEEFNLILGMDWLVEHQVSLDCASKRVTLKTIKGREIVMVGELQDYLSNVIFAIIVEKLVRKECEAYLAYVMDGNVDGTTLDNIRLLGNLRCVSRGVAKITPIY